MERRRFLLGSLGVAFGPSAARLLRVGAPPSGPTPAPAPASPLVAPPRAAYRTAPFDPALAAAWVSEENAQAGTAAWRIPFGVPATIEGYLSQVSATLGERIAFRVSTGAPSYRIEAYRMGWYQGYGGRLVWQSGTLPGWRQPDATFVSGINRYEAPWDTSFEVSLDDPPFTPGCYLFKLVASDGGARYVPLTIRDDYSHAAFVMVNAVTTWQAYNEWGGASLYFGRRRGFRTFEQRARVVSFDRPYDWGGGAADFLGTELPLLMRLEEEGLDVTYVTSVDVHSDPSRLLRHRCVLTPGHDEYWSKSMRDGFESARDQGINLAFLGANTCYRQIRFEDSGLGIARREVCYKSASEDPEARRNPALATVNWRDAPVSRSEATLVGLEYAGVLEEGADMVVTDTSSWVWEGTDVRAGQRLRGVVGGEYDSVASASPRNLEVLTRSPVGKGFSNSGYYSASSGAGVFASGSIWWIGQLNQAPGGVPQESTVYRATMNILRLFGLGPAGKTHPSTSSNRR